MDMDREDLAIFTGDENTACECIQVAPMGRGRTAILFVLSDPDYVTTISLVFIVDDFDARKSRRVHLTRDWLMSLSSSDQGELFALEATTWIQRYSGRDWSRQKVSDMDMRRVWAGDPAGPLLVGSGGRALQLSGDAWLPVEPVADVQYFDAHGHPGHGSYACGAEGAVHRLAGRSWQPLELHRHDRFRGIDVGADATIRLAGDNGVCLRVANDEVVEIEASDLTYFGVRSFRDHVYWGDEAGVYIEDGDDLVPFEETGIAFDLRTDGDFLYVAGTDRAWRFDGTDWKTLQLIYNGEFVLV